MLWFPWTTSSGEHNWSTELMSLLLRRWGILSHTSWRTLSIYWRICGSGSGPVTCQPSVSQICSIEFGFRKHEDITFVLFLFRKGNQSPGEHDLVPSCHPFIWHEWHGVYEVIINHCIVRDHNKSQDLTLYQSWSELHFEWCGSEFVHQWICQHRPSHHTEKYNTCLQDCFSCYVLYRWKYAYYKDQQKNWTHQRKQNCAIIFFSSSYVLFFISCRFHRAVLLT